MNPPALRINFRQAVKFQLVIRNVHEETLAEFFARGTVVEVESLPCCVGGRSAAGVDKVVPRLGRSMLRFAEEQGSLTVEVSRPGATGAEPRMVVRHGERLELGDVSATIYMVRARAKVSWRASALGALAVVVVVLALAAQVVAFCAVPYLMSHSNRWRRQGELQAINYQTDALRKALRKLEPPDAVNAAYQQALLDELDERARFLRRHGEELSDHARGEMLANLARFDLLVEKLAEHPQFLLQDVDLQVDEPVKKILEAN